MTWSHRRDRGLLKAYCSRSEDNLNTPVKYSKLKAVLVWRSWYQPNVAVFLLSNVTQTCLFFTKMFRLYSLIIHKASAKTAITGRQTIGCYVMRWRGEVHCDLYECCYMLMVPGHNWRWGRTEIAPWIMRQWCIDTLIKGKLRLRPFGCCGFDERGLSDSISTCRYGRSFWWLTLWKATQHQCRVTALIFTLPRLL